MSAVLAVVAETDHGELTTPTLECVAEARDIALERGDRIHALLPGSGVAPLAEELAAHGADRVTVIDHEALAQFSADGWLAALEPVLKEARPALIIGPDSEYGRTWLARLSGRWRMPLVTSCSRVRVVEDGYPEAYRFTHDRRVHERLVWARGTMAGFMLAPGVRGIGPPRPPEHTEIEIVTPKLDPTSFRDRIFRTLPPDPSTVDLTDAERIVGAGLGVGGPEGMSQLQQLADLLGATLGGTRVAADRGWLAQNRFIGTTGKIVSPKLYLAFGISGAGQHVAGIGNSEIIIAVNTDRTSPLLKMADLGVIGDLHEIVPLLVRKLEEAMNERAAPDQASTPSPTIEPVSSAMVPDGAERP